MGEKFAANPVTGTGSMSVPIATSPGRSGFGPQLSLSYDSGAGNGPFGFGWSLSLPSITRKTDKGLPKYQDADEPDVFILSGAEDLVPVLVDKGGGKWEREQIPPRTVGGKTYLIQRYRSRIEGLFACIERWADLADPGDTFWRSISKDNITTLYGKDANSRVADPADPTRIFSWLICETRDDKGNAVVYEYKAEDSSGVDLTQAHERNRTPQSRSAQRYLKRIQYGNRESLLDNNGHRPVFLSGNPDWLFEVVLDYGEHDETAPSPTEVRPWPARPDPFSSYRAGFEVRTYRLCQRVLMFHHIPNLPTGEPGYDGLVRSTDFTYAYEEDPASTRNPVYSFLTSVTQCGYRREGAGYLKRSLPPLEFSYSLPQMQEVVEELDAGSAENLPIGLDGTTYQWTDLHGEGIPGILTEQAGAWFYKRNLSPLPVRENGTETVKARLAPVEAVAIKPNLALAAGAQFMDLAGDGQPDLVVMDGPTPGLYEHDGEEGWQPFRPFTSRLNRDIRDPNLRFVDLDGDGHADVLITEDDAFVWYPSLAEEGFGPATRLAQALDEEKGPRLVFADGTQSIYLADMSGDGLTDLVRIRNGEVCYWPNLGYGRFGAKVTMDNAPWFDSPDQFDQRRMRLADIDGSGTNDILYLHRDGVRLYFNQSGNCLSEARHQAQFPHADNVSSVMAADLLGNGTACLVWSSPLPGDARSIIRYIDLMGGTKPHLLVKSVNNLGAETRVQYAPSTKFYLADKLAGKPWITRLPFPVHVVERVETYDRISHNRFVTCYAYHHGYFDGEEREFRGFGMVEQWDTEEFSSFAPIGAESEGATNWDAASHVLPVQTRTWFHTGIYLGRDHVSDYFAGLRDEHDTGEYYREPGLTDAQARALLLDDTVLPEGLTVEEEREACRALKGMMLCQEVYALDGTDKEPHPYTVAEQNFTIRVLQHRGPNRHAAFFTHPCEALTYHYERNPADPRIQHALTLEVDDFGNVLKEAAVGYGRRQADLTLSPGDRAKQAQILITYTENRVTNAIDTADDHRTPLSAETRTYELTGLTLPSGRSRFTFDEVLETGSTAIVLDYEQDPTVGRLEKRLIEHMRTYYRRNNLAGPLPLGELQSLALPFESDKLAFTPGLVAEVYGGRATDAMLEDEARYVHTEGDANWWIPSGQIFYSPNPADTPAQELTYARQHFFLPHRYRDPFYTDAVSTESFVTYDVYDLLVQETRDALGNRITVGERDASGAITRRANDYRALQPWLVSDPNCNRSAVAFDTLGMVVGTAVMGKPEETLGDSLEDFVADLDETTVLNHLHNPLAGPHSILGRATTWLVYDLFAYQRTKDGADPQPAVVHTLTRETHESDLNGQQTKVQHSFSYSDGFGREIQKKIQAEPGPVPQRDAGGRIIVGVDGQPVMTPYDVSPRWVGSGWTVFNNKGKPVRQYEPFFTDTHRFEFEPKIGVSPVLFYDPVERVVAALHPNHTWEKVVFDPWRQATWDVNDTLLLDPMSDPDVGGFFRRLPEADWRPTWHGLRTDPAHVAAFAVRYPDAALRTRETQAARQTELHATTPTVAHFDTLGRTFLTLAHNRFRRNGSTVEEQYPTRVELDIEGNQREVIDAKDRVVMRYDYDLLSNHIHQASMEAGERWLLNDVAGNPIRAWDSRGFMRRMTYDELRRSTGLFVTENGAERLAKRTEYGETQGEGGNHRGKIFRQFDQAGVVTNVAYDFKGNLLESTRQLTRNYKTAPDWNGSPTLESETFTGRTRFDALNRPIELRPPDGSIVRPGYNEANLIERIEANLRGVATATVFVADIDYNAKGQRECIAYGNGATTTYAYDPLTFRLTRLTTTRNGGDVLQDLSYTYDPAGNITEIRDDVQQTIYFNNAVVEPHAAYTYDAIYRLIEATGREHIGQSSLPVPASWDDAPRVRLAHQHDGQAMRRYTERYEYDAVGNFLRLVHQATNGSWTREYAYEEPSLLEPGKASNRLSRTSIGATVEPYSHDAHGNMTRMPHLPLMRWDFEDQLQATSQQVVTNGGAPETTYYVYDAAGQRVRKVTERQAPSGQTPTRLKERIYLGGFEVYREYAGDGQTIMLERETLHLMDGQQRIALVETRTAGSDPAPAQLIRYQLGNHLGSASLELDDTAQIISYEEYYSYGSTSYQAVRSQTETPKRYRYTGKERDEESGLYYHGARYYAPWIGRWFNPDIAGLVDGPCTYCYCRSNPIVLSDPSGTQGQPPLPGMIGNDPRIGALWERAVVETLGPRFQAQTYGDVVRAFQNEVASRIAAHGGALGSNRATGTAVNYARRTYQSVRTAFGRLAAQSGISLQGIQVHHAFDELARVPQEALTTTNLMFAQGNAGNVGSAHNFAHRVSDALAAGARNPAQQVVAELDAAGVVPDVPELSPTIREPSSPSTTSAAARTRTVPATSASRATSTTRGACALTRARDVGRALAQGAERAALTVTRALGATARGGARVLGVAGRVAAPLAIAESSVRLATATNNLDRLQAGADTAAGAASYAGPVGVAFSVGYGAGQLLDVGVEAATGESLSSRGARGMEAVDRAISSVLPEDESLPEYKRENRIAWWLIDTFNL
ncbi:MAG: FG-GAP-like repeat-containing protein [Nitrospira sp.]|nr:FG-GAP-like repeat-containing protein [Nitrospira sp.]